MVRYVRVKVKSALQKSGLPDIDYALNPYAGCFHACRYCYAPNYTPYREVSQNWGEVVYIKENIVEVLSREVGSKKRGVVGVSTITDPYQPVEKKELLTRKSIEVLLLNGFHVSVQTKSDLVLRDLDLLSGRPVSVDVGFTIITVRDGLSRKVEPYAPPPSRRIKALREIAEAGIETWVFLGPIIPGFNDNAELLEEVVAVAGETKSELVFDYLRVKPGIAERLSFAGVALSMVSRAVSASWRRKVGKTLGILCRRHGVKCAPAFPPKKRMDRNLLSFMKE